MSGLCECGSSETLKHVFLECRTYRTERHALFDRLLGLGVQAFSLFGHCENHKLISEVSLQFLFNTGLYVKIEFIFGPVEGSNTLNSI